MARIDTNLDDLQSGVDACSRAADAFRFDAARLVGLASQIKNASVIDSLVRCAAQMKACARNQRDALRELRASIARLQHETRRSHRTVRPPALASGADGQRRYARRRSRPAKDLTVAPGPRQVKRCLICGGAAIDSRTHGRVVTTMCRSCFAVLLFEFDPPDRPDIRARIERLDDGADHTN
jgi:hypothetical protein